MIEQGMLEPFQYELQQHQQEQQDQHHHQQQQQQHDLAIEEQQQQHQQQQLHDMDFVNQQQQQQHNQQQYPLTQVVQLSSPLAAPVRSVPKREQLPSATIVKQQQQIVQLQPRPSQQTLPNSVNSNSNNNSSNNNGSVTIFVIKTVLPDE